jgi:hypothetical protein
MTNIDADEHFSLNERIDAALPTMSLAEGVGASIPAWPGSDL